MNMENSSSSSISCTNLSPEMRSEWIEALSTVPQDKVEGLRMFKNLADKSAQLDRSQRQFLYKLFKSTLDEEDSRGKLYALWGMGNMAAYLKEICDIKTLLHFIYALADQTADDVRSVAYWCVSSIFHSNKLADADYDEVLSYILLRRDDQNPAARSNIVGIIASCAKRHIPPSKFDTILHCMIEECGNANYDVRMNAIVVVGCLVALCRPYDDDDLTDRDNNKTKFTCVFPLTLVQTVYDIAMLSSRDFMSIVRRNSLFVLSELINKRFVGVLAPSCISAIYDRVLSYSTADNHGVQSFTLSCLASFYRSKYLTSSQEDESFHRVKEALEEQDESVLPAALQALRDYVTKQASESRNLSPADLSLVLDYVLQACEVSDYEVTDLAYMVLEILAKKCDVTSHAKKVLWCAMRGTSSESDISRHTAILVLDYLGIHSRIPEAHLLEVIQKLLSKASEYKHPSMYRETGAVDVLFNRNIIPSVEAKNIVFEMLGTTDEYDDVRSDALFALANLVESNNIPHPIRDKILRFFMMKARDPCGDAAACALAGAASFAEIDTLPSHRYEDVLSSMMSHVDHPHDDARNNAIATISCLAIHKHIPTHMRECLWHLLVGKLDDRYGGVRVWSVIGISQLLPDMESCDADRYDHIVRRCIGILLILVEDPIRKFRSVQGLCFFTDIGRYGDREAEVKQAIVRCYEQGDSFFEKITSPARKMEVSRVLTATAESIISKVRSSKS